MNKHLLAQQLVQKERFIRDWEIENGLYNELLDTDLERSLRIDRGGIYRG